MTPSIKTVKQQIHFNTSRDFYDIYVIEFPDNNNIDSDNGLATAAITEMEMMMMTSMVVVVVVVVAMMM